MNLKDHNRFNSDFLDGKHASNSANNVPVLDENAKIPLDQLPTGITKDTVSLGNHKHDDIYYTEEEMDEILTTSETNINTNMNSAISDSKTEILGNVSNNYVTAKDYNDFKSDGYTPIFVYSYEESNTYLEKEYHTDKEKRLYKIHLKNIGKGERFSYGEFVIFDPNQVKSATDNIGTFSTTDNNIRHSSITEHTAKVASISTFTDRLPISQQAKFATMVGQGDIKVSCV